MRKYNQSYPSKIMAYSYLLAILQRVRVHMHTRLPCTISHCASPSRTGQEHGFLSKTVPLLKRSVEIRCKLNNRVSRKEELSSYCKNVLSVNLPFLLKPHKKETPCQQILENSQFICCSVITWTNLDLFF